MLMATGEHQKEHLKRQKQREHCSEVYRSLNPRPIPQRRTSNGIGSYTRGYSLDHNSRCNDALESE